MKIKVKYQDDTRRVGLPSPPTFAALHDFVTESFQLNDFQLGYMDDEGDHVTISSTDELLEAIHVAKSEQRPSLKIAVRTTGTSYNFHNNDAGFTVLSRASSVDSITSEPLSPASGAGSEDDFVVVNNSAPSSPKSANDPTTVDEAVAIEPAVLVEVVEDKLPSGVDEGKDAPSHQEKPKSAADQVKEEYDEWKDFPSTEDLLTQFAEFRSCESVQGELALAATTLYNQLSNGESMTNALEAMFLACPAIASHALVLRIRPYISLVVERISNWVSTLLPLGREMVVELAPQILDLLPSLFDGKRSDVQLDITSAFERVAGTQAPGPDCKHFHIVCDGCEQGPITGIRYRCADCVDFDLCETCEAKNEHDPTHALLKLRVPRGLPRRRLLRRQGGRCGTSQRGMRCKQTKKSAKCAKNPAKKGVNKGARKVNSDKTCARTHKASIHDHPLVRVNNPSGWACDGRDQPGGCVSGFNDFWKSGNARRFRCLKGCDFDLCGKCMKKYRQCKRHNKALAGKPRPGCEQKSDTPQLQAKFLDHVNVPRRCVCAPGAALVKSWRVHNASSLSWPSGTRLFGIHPDSELTISESSDVNLAEPDEIVEVSTMLQAPGSAGEYRAMFRLGVPSSGSSERELFGDTLCVDVIVKDPEPSSELKEPVAAPQPEPIAAEPDEYADKLLMLKGMGFHDETTNRFYLSKHKGSLESVVEELISHSS